LGGIVNPCIGLNIAPGMKMRIHRFLFLFPLLALALTACFPASPAASAAGTPTPTPFLPVFAADGSVEDPVSQPVSQPSIYMASFPPPSAASDIAIPNSVGRIDQPEGQLNILILGSDQRPADGGFRTDVILLLTLNPNGGTATASLTSFPRDLYVYEPGWRVDRINAAFGHGGFQMMADTMEYNFGVRPDHYVLVNFEGFKTIVDALGGVTVQVAQPLSDERDGPGDFSVPSGPVNMDGETALWYVRSRGTSSDFDRTRREQEVLEAVFWKLLSLDAITKAPELYEQYKQTVVTDIGIVDILPLLPLAVDLGSSGNIHRYAVGPAQVDPYTTSGGAAVLLPKYDVILDILRQALNSPR
jgi:LCP family protein required for cell wall assembly